MGQVTLIIMFSKIILTILAVAVVWFGFKYVQRSTEAKVRREERERAQRQGGPRFTPNPDGESVQDLIKCPRCGTYRSAKLGSCGQAGCPY